MPEEPPGPAGLEDDRREHPGQDRGFGSLEQPRPECLGDEEVGLVVDPGQAMAGIRQGPSLDVAGHLQHGDPVGELARQQVRLPGLPLGERALQHPFGCGAVEARHEVDGQVVRRPEG